MQACMQYTIRNIPKAVDAALRRRAKRQGRTLNEVVVEAMTEALGLLPESPRRRSVRDILGALPKDPELEAVLREHRQIDPELWR
jgi:plasmid stability protein